MARLVPLDGAYEVQVAGTHTGVTTYRRQADGTINVAERHAKNLVREGLAFVASAAGPTAHMPGYRCPDCGRRNYFKTCGACGSADGAKET